MKPKPLTAKQAAFVREYLVDKNAKQAAIRVGYSARTAEQQGSRLYRNVQVRAAIDEGLAKQAEKADITAQRVLEELAKVAFVPLDLESRARASDEALGLLLSVEVKDKLKALELLGKNLKLFTDKVEHEHAFSTLTDEQLQARLDAALAAVST